MVIGGLTTLAGGLSQWIQGGTIPAINWIVIIAGCFVGAATQLLAFLSQSFGDYKIQMRADGNGNSGIMKPVVPLALDGTATPIAEITLAEKHVVNIETKNS